MSQKQLNRYSVISKLNDGLITVKDAAECLGLSERQIIRLKKGVKEEGAGFLKHKNTGRKPQHAIPDEIAEKIVALKKSETYLQANFKHFQELLLKKMNPTGSWRITFCGLAKRVNCLHIG